MEKENKKEEFFDDCLICRAMKAAKEQGRELTSEELKEAFKKAKEQGAIVGGEWFQEDKPIINSAPVSLPAGRYEARI